MTLRCVSSMKSIDSNKLLHGGPCLFFFLFGNIAHRQLRVFRKAFVVAARMPESCSATRRWHWRKPCTSHLSKSTRRRACWRKGGFRQKRGIVFQGVSRFVRTPSIAVTQRRTLRCDLLAFLSDKYIYYIVLFVISSVRDTDVPVVQIIDPPNHPPLLTLSTFFQRVAAASPPWPYLPPPRPLVGYCVLSSAPLCVSVPLHSLFV